MDVHEFRLQLFLCGRSRDADANPRCPSGVPAKPGGGFGCRIRISQLARATGPKIPRAETLVRHTSLRRRGIAVSRSAPCGTGTDFLALGAGGFTLRVNGSSSAEFDLFPAERLGSVERGTPAALEPQREAIPLPHAVKWQVHDSVLRGPNTDRTAARPAGMGRNPQGSGVLAGCRAPLRTAHSLK